MQKFKEMLSINLERSGAVFKIRDLKDLKTTRDTIDQYSEQLRENYPNTCDHNESVVNRWFELIQDFTLGSEILDSSDYDQQTKNFVNNHGEELYYNVDYNNNDDKWIITPVDSVDALNQINGTEF